jgi:hypothetical protein
VEPPQSVPSKQATNHCHPAAISPGSPLYDPVNNFLQLSRAAALAVRRHRNAGAVLAANAPSSATTTQCLGSQHMGNVRHVMSR